MAGYSGGRKVIAPGIAGKETITTFHGARFMGHPCAVNCVLEGNPLHQEQLAIAAMVGRVLCANVVIDEARRLSFVNFGEVVASHRLAVEYVARYAVVPAPRRFRTIVSSAAPCGWASMDSRRTSTPSGSPTSTSGKRRCSSSRCGSAACRSTPACSPRPTAR